jgi:hypothetical protein
MVLLCTYSLLPSECDFYIDGPQRLLREIKYGLMALLGYRRESNQKERRNEQRKILFATYHTYFFGSKDTLLR